MTWICKHFRDLTVEELYGILELRSEVFVVEQQCIYQDIDGLDRDSLHCFVQQDGALVAYLRMIPPGLAYESPAMGRFVTAPAHRGGGWGRKLLRYAIPLLFETWDVPRFEVGAQVYMQGFYEREGFAPLGQPYEEDGIPHIHMVYHREQG